MSNKTDLRDLPGIGNSDSQVPFPSRLLAGISGPETLTPWALFLKMLDMLGLALVPVFPLGLT